MKIVTEVSEEKWRDFIERTPGASIFQSPDMARVFRQTKGYQPHVVASLSGGSVTGLLASVVVSHHTGFLSPLASRAIVVGGPIGDPKLFPILLAAHDNLTSKIALLTQIRNLTAPQDRAPFVHLGYRWEEHLNFIVNLDRPEEALSRGMSKGRRKAIEKANQSGLMLTEVGRRELPAAYTLLQETYSRARIPLAHQSLFECALEILGPSGRLWILGASMADKLCAVRFVLRWGRTLFDWYAGSSELGRASHADEWLVWETFRRGMKTGSIEFDFGGAGPPGSSYGPGEFKRRFGGQIVAPGRFVKAYHPLALRASKALYLIWKACNET